MSAKNNPQVVASNARKIAEARVLAAAVAGQTKKLNEEARVLADLASKTNNALATVTKAMGPTLEVKRVKKKNMRPTNNNGPSTSLVGALKKTVSDATNGVLIAVAIMLLVFLEGALSSPLGSEPFNKFFGKGLEEVQSCLKNNDVLCPDHTACMGRFKEKVIELKLAADDCNDFNIKVLTLTECTGPTSDSRSFMRDKLTHELSLCYTGFEKLADSIDTRSLVNEPAKVICQLTGCDVNEEQEFSRRLHHVKRSNPESLGEIEQAVNMLVSAANAKSCGMLDDEKIINAFMSQCKKNMESLNNKYSGRYRNIIERLKTLYSVIEKHVNSVSAAQLTEISDKVDEILVRTKRSSAPSVVWPGFNNDNESVISCMATGNIVCLDEAGCKKRVQSLLDALPSLDVEEKTVKERKTVIEQLEACAAAGSEVYKLIRGGWLDYYSRHLKYQACLKGIEAMTKSLTLMMGAESKPKNVVNEKNCASELTELNKQYVVVKKKGHKSAVKLGQKNNVDPCSNNINWKTDGWLGGDSGSCVTGITNMNWNARDCVEEPYSNCMHIKSDFCVIGHGNVSIKDGKMVGNSHKSVSKPICCTLPCFKMDAVYLAFTNQPLCVPCIKAFSAIFWSDACLKDRQGAVAAINIYKSQTVFEFKNAESLTCQNSYRFQECCAGRGPVPIGTRDSFRDKHCVCSSNKVTLLDMLLAKLNTLKNNFFVMEHLALFVCTFVIFCWHRGLGLVVFVAYCGWLLVSVQGACSIENMVPRSQVAIAPTSKTTAEHMRVRPGQCFVAGDSTVEIISMRVFHVYNFLRAIPYKIKPVCQHFDWGCKGGLSDGVYNIQSDCYKNCVPGLRTQLKDSEADWYGDECLLMGRVATRLDVCFSYGEVSTFVDLYNRVTGDPHLDLTVKFHGLGFEEVGHITTSSLDSVNRISIYNIKTNPMMWPEMLSYRLGKYLCAYHYVESSNTCNSGDIFKPFDIDVDCLNLKKKWDIVHGGYVVEYGTKDFEKQLHNSFMDCPSKSHVENSATTMRYFEDIDWVEFDVSAKMFEFGKDTPRCSSLASWKIKVEPGVVGYHKTTKIEFMNSGNICSIFFDLDDCLSTNGRLIVLGSHHGPHIIEYWCDSNATGRAQITLDNGLTEVKTFTILNNYVPHKNSVRNLFNKIVKGGSLDDVTGGVKGIFDGMHIGEWYRTVTNYVGTLFSIGSTRLFFGLVFCLGAWNCFVRGNIVGTVFCAIMFWLFVMTKLVLASSKSHRPDVVFADTIVQYLSAFILSCIYGVISSPLRVVRLICFIVRTLYASVIWFANLVLDIDVTRWEHLLNVSFEFCLIAGSIAAENWLLFKAAIVWCCYLNCKNIVHNSPVVNRHIMYLQPLAAIATLTERSVRKAVVNDTDNAHNTSDTVISQTEHRVAGVVNAIVYCAPRILCANKTIIPLSSKVRDGNVWSIFDDYGVMYYYYSKPTKKDHWCLMRHGVEANHENALDCVYFRGQILSVLRLTSFPRTYDYFEVKEGWSGTCFIRGDDLFFFSGYVKDRAVFTNRAQRAPDTIKLQFDDRVEYEPLKAYVVNSSAPYERPRVAYGVDYDVSTVIKKIAEAKDKMTGGLIDAFLKLRPASPTLDMGTEGVEGFDPILGEISKDDLSDMENFGEEISMEMREVLNMVHRGLESSGEDCDNQDSEANVQVEDESPSPAQGEGAGRIMSSTRESGSAVLQIEERDSAAGESEQSGSRTPLRSQVPVYHTFKDFVGANYKVKPNGLIGERIWPRHLYTGGVQLCGDVMVRSRVEPIYSGVNKLDAHIFGIPKNFIYTFAYDKSTNTAEPVVARAVGTRLWCDQDVQPNSRRATNVQLSYVFQCDEILTSGSGIYIKTSCTQFVLISVITKSYESEGKRYYYISRPCDERIYVSLQNKFEENTDRNNAPAFQDSVTVEGWTHYKRSNTYITELLNKDKRAVVRLQASLEGFGINGNRAHSSDGSFFRGKTQQAFLAHCTRHGLDCPSSVLGSPGARKLIGTLSSNICDLDVYCALGLIGELVNTNILNMQNVDAIKHRLERIYAKNGLLSDAQPWWVNFKNMISTDSTLAEETELTGEYEMDDPYMVVGPWDKTTIAPQANIVVVLKKEGVESRLQSDGSGTTIEIVERQEEIREHIRVAVLKFASMGARTIKISIPEAYWCDDQIYAGEFKLPYAFCLTTCLIIQTDNEQSFKSYIGEDAAQQMLFVDDPKKFLHRHWWSRTPISHVNNSVENLSTYIAAWKRVPSAILCSPCEVVMSNQSTHQTLAEIGYLTDSFYVCLIRNFSSRGSCYIYKDSVITSYHCTKGNGLRVTHVDRSMRFDRPVYQNEHQDICMYGKKLTFATMTPGEIVVSFNPITKFGMYFLVETVEATLEGRPGVKFAKLIPIKLANNGQVIPCGYHYGCSGSPIINSNGEPVGVFGLGTDAAIMDHGAQIHTVAHYSPIGLIKIDYKSFFDLAARNFVHGILDFDQLAFYLNAPTGSGKTTQFPIALAKELINNGNFTGVVRILVCQPNVDAVKNGSKRAAAAAVALGVKRLKITYHVGLGNEDARQDVLDVNDPMVQIDFKTYGKQWAGLDSIRDYAYVILDEVHVIGDADVVAMMVHLETVFSGSAMRILYLSATHISNTRLKDAADGETLSSCPHSITTLHWTVERPETGSRFRSRVESGRLYLGPDVIRRKRNDYISIDMRHLTDKTTVFFCATRQDCEAGSSFATSQGYTSYHYHGGVSQNVLKQICEQEGTCWVFATNVIQQSITIPNLVTVVDFGKECRPSVTLGTSPLMYECKLDSRDIDIATSMQRKGRAGRTRPGMYITSPTSHQPTRSCEQYVMPVVVMKLLQHHRSLDNLVCSNPAILDEIRRLKWLDPDTMKQLLIERIDDVMPERLRASTSSRPPSIDFNHKLRLLQNTPVDIVKYYLRSWITEEERQYWSAHGQGELVRELTRTHPVISRAEQDRFSRFVSFNDPTDVTVLRGEGQEDLTLDDAREIDEDTAQDLLHNMSATGYVGAVFGLVGAGMVIYELIDRRCDRYVTHCVSMPLMGVQSTARHYADYCVGKAYTPTVISSMVILKRAQSEISGLLKRKCNNIFLVFPWLKREDVEGVPMTSTDWTVTLNNLISSAMIGLAKWSETYGMQLGSVFGSLSGGGLLGMLYKDIDKTMGTSLAMIVGSIVHGIVFGMVSSGAYSVFAVSQIVAMFARGVCSSWAAKDGSLYRANPNTSGLFWTAIISAGMGVGVSSVISKSLIPQTTTQSITAIIKDIDGPGAPGQVGVPLLLVKHIYHLLSRADDVGSYGSSATSIGCLLLQSGPLTFLYGGALATCIFAAQMVTEYFIDKYASREMAGAGGISHFDERKRKLRNAIGWVLDATAVIVYPSSLISVVIGAISNCIAGTPWRQSLEKSWSNNAGVSPVVTLVSEIWRHLITARQGPVRTQSDRGTISEMIAHIMCGIYTVCGKCKEWSRVVGDVIVSAWRKIKDFLFDNVLRPVTSVIGCEIRSGVNSIVTENWLTRRLIRFERGSPIERVPLINRNYSNLSRIMLDRYLRSNLAEIDSLWVEVGAGSKTTYGAMLENRLVDEVRLQRPVKGSRLVTAEPLDLYKIPMDGLLELLNTCVTDTRLVDDILSLKVPLERNRVVDVEFTNTFETHRMVSCIKYKSGAFVGYWLIVATSKGEFETDIIILEYGDTDGLTVGLFDILQSRCSLLVGTRVDLKGPEIVTEHCSLFRIEACLLPKFGKIGKAVHFVKGTIVSLASKWLTKMQEKIAFNHPMRLSNLNFLNEDEFSNQEIADYCRFWQLYLLKSRYLHCKITDRSYKKPKWNLPHQVKANWMHCEQSERFSEASHTRLVFGATFEVIGNHFWDTPFLVCNDENVMRQLLEIISYNYEVNIRLDYWSPSGEPLQDWLLSGTTCKNHYLVIVMRSDSTHMSIKRCTDENHRHQNIHATVIQKTETFKALFEQFVNEFGKVHQISTLELLPKCIAKSDCDIRWQELYKAVSQPSVDGLTDSNSLIRSAKDYLSKRIRLWYCADKVDGQETTNADGDSGESEYEEATGVYQFSSGFFEELSHFFKTYFSGEHQGIDILERVNFLLTTIQKEEIVINSYPTSDELLELSQVDQFYDANDIQLDDPSSVVGFTEPTKGKLTKWSWFTLPRNDPSAILYTVTEADVMNSYKLLCDRGVNKKEWENMRYTLRYKLPKSLEKRDTEELKVASRAYYKMQQLYEADPAFFENTKVLFDPTSGYGGFTQYLTQKLREGAPRCILVGSLIEKAHRVPDIERLSSVSSNMRVISLLAPDVDNGDLRHKKVLDRYLKVVHSFGGVDLIMFDVGEFFQTSRDQYNWWTKPSRKLLDCEQVSLIEGMCILLNSLRSGGKMVLKWTGYFGGGTALLYELLKRFKHYKAIKLGTSSLFTTEFYIFASGFGEISGNKVKVEGFYRTIGENIYSQLVKAHHCMRHHKDLTSYERFDWEYPVGSGVVYTTDSNDSARPGKMEWSLNVGNKRLEVMWDPRWDSRFEQFMKVVRFELYKEKGGRKLRYQQGSVNTYSKIYQHGWFFRPTKNIMEKHSKNELLSSLCYHVTKTTDNNSTMGQCQATPEFREASIKKRLDVVAPSPPGYVLEELAKILELMVTSYGKEILGTCDLLGKEQVYNMMNKNGATSILSKSSNLRAFVEDNANWYEMAMFYCVRRWQKGESTHSFFNIMHKNEAKAKKNVVAGNIILERGPDIKYGDGEIESELKKYNNLPHRFIQFGDEITRIAHYIVFGDLLEKNSYQKIYKGTVNGCPPTFLGNVLRAAWDLNNYSEENKIFTYTHINGNRIGDQVGSDLEVDLIDLESNQDAGPPCGLSIDYSSWDSSVSVGERMLEADRIAAFYKPQYRNLIMNACREMAFAICLDHDGNVLFRAGQRGSGEILTSIGNTQLVVANTIRAVCKTLGITFEEALKTRAVIRCHIGDVTKVYEVTKIPQFSDGDDTVILTTKSIAEKIAMNLDDELSLAGKTIRSGTKSGCSVSHAFSGVEFCSHNYEGIIIGPNAQFISCRDQDHKRLCLEIPQLRIRYLPTRPTSDIIGKLRATLKQSAFKYKHDDDSLTGSKVLTRSKLLSYLLLYPHCRYVRYMVLSGLTVTGDGTVDFKELVKRWSDYKYALGHCTLMGAVHSVYGVRSLDDIGLRQYGLDRREGKILRRHARLIGEDLDVKMASHVARCANWILSYPSREWNVLANDSKLLGTVWKGVLAGQIKPTYLERNKIYLQLQKARKENKIGVEGGPNLSITDTFKVGLPITNYLGDS